MAIGIVWKVGASDRGKCTGEGAAIGERAMSLAEPAARQHAAAGATVDRGGGTGAAAAAAGPEVSVIVASYNSRRSIANCLRSLQGQQTAVAYEVIVVDSSSDGTDRLVARDFPWVRLLHFAERKYPGAARNAGIEAAGGAIIAFTDADCRADPHWLEGIRSAHRLPGLAIGGGIANGSPESWVGWAAFLMEFSRWLPAPPVRSMDDIATANMSYKREVFERHGRFIEGTYCSDSELHWRLGRAGQRLLFVPSAQVAHCSIESLPDYLVHEFHHGKSFARVQARARRFSGWRRLAYASLAPLIAAFGIGKTTLWNLRARLYLRRFVASFPLVLAGFISWSVGEAAGYLTGDWRTASTAGRGADAEPRA